jgi:hypothetical protein
MVLLAALLLATSVHPGGSADWYLADSDGSGALIEGEGFDPSEPGVVVQVDPGDHLEFVADHDGLELVGRAVVRLWTSSAEPGAAGEIRVSLLACERGECRALASTRLLEEPWARGDSLEPKSVELSSIDQVLDSGERICLRIEVLGDQAIVFGYGSPAHPSSVVLPVVGSTSPAVGAGGDAAEPDGASPSPEPDAEGIAEASPEDRSDLVSRPGLGFAAGMAGGGPGWLPPLVIMVVVTSALAAFGALAAWGQRAIADRDLRTRRLPGRPVPR